MNKIFPASIHSVVALFALMMLQFARAFLLNRYPDLSWSGELRVERLFTMAAATVSFAWMYRDRQKRGETFVALSLALAALYWPIGLPLYLLFTRSGYGFV